MTEYLRFPDSVKDLFTQMLVIYKTKVYLLWPMWPKLFYKVYNGVTCFMFGFVPSVFDTFFQEPALFLGAGLVFWSSELVLLFGFAFVRGAGLFVWRCLVFLFRVALLPWAGPDVWRCFLYLIWSALLFFRTSLGLSLVVWKWTCCLKLVYSSCLELILFICAGLAVWNSICSQSWSLCPALVFLFKVALLLFGAGLVVGSCSCCLYQCFLFGADLVLLSCSYFMRCVCSQEPVLLLVPACLHTR